MLAQNLTFCLVFFPLFLRSLSVLFFRRFIFRFGCLGLAGAVAYYSLLVCFYRKFIVFIVISYVPAPASKWINSIRAKKFLIQIWAVYVLFLCVFSTIYVNQLFPREKKMNTKTLKNNKKRTINLICLYICLVIYSLLINLIFSVMAIPKKEK